MLKTLEDFYLGNLMKDLDSELSTESKNFTKEEKNLPFVTNEERFLPNQKISLNNILNEDRNQDKKNEEIFSTQNNNSLKKTEKIQFGALSKEFIINSFSNQKATILLQKGIREANKSFINDIVNELSGSFNDIMKDRNGNYFCSDLFKVCTKAQRIKIIQEVNSYLYETCLDEHGTHPIQTLIELSMSIEEYQLLISSFTDMNKILQASLNANGSYVIQKLICHIPEEYRINFNIYMSELVYILSLDMYGVCTVKKFLTYTKNEFVIDEIFKNINLNLGSISQNQYGNYLIQFVLKNWWLSPRCFYIKNKIMSNFLVLACNRFASHICELYIKLCNPEEKKYLLFNIQKNENLLLLSKNKYGNNILVKIMKFLFINNYKYEINYNNNQNNYFNVNNHQTNDNEENISHNNIDLQKYLTFK